MKTGAVAIVRNAVDLAPLTALHHVLIGAETVWVIDNGSTDGTYEVLRDLATKSGLRVYRDDGPFDQARMATDLSIACRAMAPPDRLFDSDECWDLSIPRLARFMARNQANAVTGNAVNYVQARSVLVPAPASWCPASRRVKRTLIPATCAAP